MALRLILCIFLFSPLMTSCGPRYCDFFPCYNDGRAKPIVALVPLMDTSDAELCWDMQEEFTDLLYRKALEDNTLSLLPRDKVFSIASKYNPQELNGRNIDFALRFQNAEFVVLMELVEHKIVPYEIGKIIPLYSIHNRACNSVLMMKVRLRIIDVRNDEPILVLQELFNSNHLLPLGEECRDYADCSWKTPQYSKTYLALVHQRIVNDILGRVDQMIQSAR